MQLNICPTEGTHCISFFFSTRALPYFTIKLLHNSKHSFKTVIHDRRELVLSFCKTLTHIISCFWKKSLMHPKAAFLCSKNTVKIAIMWNIFTIQMNYYLNVLFQNVIYSCDAKLNFQHHYSSLIILICWFADFWWI